MHVLQLSLIRSTVTASVRRPRGGGGADSAPSKSASGHQSALKNYYRGPLCLLIRDKVRGYGFTGT